MLKKVSDLSGEELNFTVAVAEGHNATSSSYGHACYFHERSRLWTFPHYLEWGDAGPIIEREEISISRVYGRTHKWEANCTVAPATSVKGKGFSPLISAMRCYVTSKLGDEVEIPDCLVKVGK